MSTLGTVLPDEKTSWFVERGWWEKVAACWLRFVGEVRERMPPDERSTLPTAESCSVAVEMTPDVMKGRVSVKGTLTVTPF